MDKGGVVMSCEAYSILGIRVHALILKQLEEIIEHAVQQKERFIIGHHNLHSLYLFHHNEKMRQFYERSTYVHVDGMPIIWLGKLMGYALSRENRLTSVDWLLPVLKTCAAKQFKIFFLGSKPGVPEKAVEHFLNLIPNLEIKTQHGFFDAEEGSKDNEDVLRLINDYAPQILMVGMGMPRQEQWISDNADRLNSHIIWNLGAFMDYFAGVIPTPPRWMGRLGLEWLYRLISEPQRLWTRYLIEPWFIVGLCTRGILKKLR